ncbi:MAG: hypothetical protein HRT88_23640 [Lentisphaeraceae bacterium]|nr:hypothetical protein [Lentisphaeraceae bacterium]
MKYDKKFATGALAGAGVAALSYYLYKKNQDKVDGFLRQQGFNVPASKGASFDSMNLEELVLNKERLEDLIAEMEMNQEVELRVVIIILLWV